MATLVDPSRVEHWLVSDEVLLIDPRGPMRYLQGHLKQAVNLPLSRLLESSGRLLSDLELAKVIGSIGLDDSKRPVVYDSYDGQKGAMLAWVLEYLGCTDVCLMDIFFEGWVAQRREVFYRPVSPQTATFTPKINPAVRATLEEVRLKRETKLLDLRSEEEFTGCSDIDERAGRIPGAINLVWKELLGRDHQFFESSDNLEQKLKAAGIKRSDKVITYCRTGPRAAVGYLALQQLGYDVRLFDGSYAQWSAANLPVEP